MKFFFSEIIIAIIYLNIVICSDIVSLKLSYYYNKNNDFPSSMYLYTTTNIGMPKMNIYTYVRTDKKNNLFSIFLFLKNNINI